MQEAASAAGRETREKILGAAASLISEFGWGGVTVRLVAERAGVNNALPNYYFGSKETLLVEAAMAAARSEYEAALGAIEEADSLHGALAGAIKSLQPGGEASPVAGVLLETMLQATRDARLQEACLEVMQPYLDAVAGLIRKGIDRGEVHPDTDVEALSIVLAVLMDGLFLYRLIDRDLDLDRIAQAVNGLTHGSGGHPATHDSLENGGKTA